MMLTTSLALPPPGTGDCLITQHRDPVTGEYSATIDHADPVVLISDYVLRDVFENHNPHWFAQVRLADIIPYDDFYLGATLRIEGTNRTVVYRITGRHDEYTYIGEWV